MQTRPPGGAIYSRPFDTCDHIVVITDETIIAAPGARIGQGHATLTGRAEAFGRFSSETRRGQRVNEGFDQPDGANLNSSRWLRVPELDGGAEGE